jgi:hypothetical protein
LILRPIYKILHLILLYKKTHDHETIQIYEECLKSFYKISLGFFYIDESQLNDKFKEHNSIGEITIKSSLEDKDVIEKLNKFIEEDDNVNCHFQNLFNSLIIDFLPSIMLPLQEERNAFENEKSIPIFKIYTSKKKKIKDKNLS